MSLDEKRSRGIGDGAMALLVRGVFGEAVQKAGLKAGVVIVGSEGKRAAVSEPEFHADLRLRFWRPGSVWDVEVLRGGERREIAVRF